jgi:hypothetical protein
LCALAGKEHDGSMRKASRSICWPLSPQAEALAKMSGLSPETVRLALAILIAALIELGSGLGFWLMTVEAPKAKPAAPVEPVTVELAEPAEPAASAGADADCLVERWATDALARRKGGLVAAKDLRAIFEAWCAERELEPIKQTAFGLAMTRLGYKRKKIGGEMRYEGIALQGGRPVLVAAR